MMTDPISEFLTRVRNAQMVNKEAIKLPSSKVLVQISKLLHQHGFVGEVHETTSEGKKQLSVAIAYDTLGKPVIDGLRRVSKPGLRVYKPAAELPRVRGGMGLAVISTSQGLLTGEESRKRGIGGEVICEVW